MKALDNPVYHALLSNDAPKALGTDIVRFFDPEVSPFVGFPEQYAAGFRDLHQLLPADRLILFATRQEIPVPEGWQLLHFVPGTQFVYAWDNLFEADFSSLTPLGQEQVPQMLELTALTRPGPFGKRTIEFGNYHGIFQGEQLVAMTGRRLQVHDHTEISAVCTHPDHTGRGYAKQLLQHQVNSILAENRIPFLHVRADNLRAVELYERLGFRQNGNMNFYFLRRMEQPSGQ